MQDPVELAAKGVELFQAGQLGEAKELFWRARDIDPRVTLPDDVVEWLSTEAAIAKAVRAIAWGRLLLLGCAGPICVALAVSGSLEMATPPRVLMVVVGLAILGWAIRSGLQLTKIPAR